MKKKVIISIFLMLVLVIGAGCKKQETVPTGDVAKEATEEAVDAAQKATENTEKVADGEDAIMDGDTATFHDITFDLPKDSVSRLVSDNEIDIALNEKMTVVEFSAVDKDMTDGVQSITKWVEQVGGKDAKASEKQIAGVKAGFAEYTYEGTPMQAYLFTVNKNAYCIFSPDADVLEGIASSVKVVK